MGDWLLPSARRAQGAEALARLLPEPLHFTLLHGLGRGGGGGRLQARALGDGRPGFVCAEHGYHGHVGFSLAMDDPPLSDRYRPLTPGITRVPFGDAEALRDAVGADTAAVIMETIPATGGYLVPPDGYFAEMRRICDETRRAHDPRRGAGRARAHRAGVGFRALRRRARHGGRGQGPERGRLPGGGMLLRRPGGGALRRRTRSSIPRATPARSSAARVVEAVVARYEDPELMEHVVAMGERLRPGFDELVARHPDRLAGHRGLGLMRALDTPLGRAWASS